MERTLALVSPHLDDVILSCSRMLSVEPGAHVVTAFAGGPATVDPIPEWESPSGMFMPGADIVSVRRAEDLAAVELLGATAHHLAFWDQQYRGDTYGYAGPFDEDELTASLAAVLEETLTALQADAWFMPAGLVHRDHELTAAACRRAFHSPAAPECFAYLELPYHLESPDAVEAATALLAEAGLGPQPEELSVSGDLETKRKAVECHRSQLAPLEGRIETAVGGPESFLRLTPPRRP